jgi:putative hydrolase of the HAD superfamily
MDIYDDEVAKLVCSRWFDYLDCSLFPEVKGVLLRLKQMGLKVGLLTNASEEEISIILGKANLNLNIFDIIAGTDTLMKVKPDPNFFRYVLNKLKVKPEEAIYVGDELEADYKGAENVGMHALLIDRKEKHQQSDLKTIKNLKEILSHID